MARTRVIAQSAPVSLFERFDWAYALLREHLFRDDTRRIEDALWSDGAAPRTVVELGCGPGTYTRRLSRRHPETQLLGVDNAPRMVARARRAAMADGAPCAFEIGDACDLPIPDRSVDAVIASRLLMVLPDPADAVREMHRILADGGRCFIAEPRPSFLSRLPMLALRLLAWPDPAPEPTTPICDATFAAILRSTSWRIVSTSADDRYRYAVCERPAA